MSWIAGIGGLICAWAVLRVLGGERQARISQMLAEIERRRLAEEESAKSVTTVREAPTRSSDSPQKRAA